MSALEPQAQAGDANRSLLVETRTARRRPGVAVAQAVAAYSLFSLALPLIRLPAHRHMDGPILILAALLPTALFMLLQLWLGLSLVKLRPPPAQALLLTALSVAFWFGALYLIHQHHGWPLAANLPLALLRPLVTGLLITFACTFFGIALSRIVRERNVLLPVALVAMPVDYLGAMTPIGFTHTVMQKHPQIVQAVSVPVPTLGGLHPIGYIGPGDALFLAFFLAVVLRLDLDLRATFWWMYGLLTLTMLLVLVTNLEVAALVPMGLAVLVANGRSLRLQRSEVFATLYAAALVLALVVAFYAYSHAHLFHH